MFGIWYHVPCVGTFIIKVDLCLKQLPVCISLLHTLFRFWAHVMSGYSIDRYKLPLPERCTASWVEKNVQLQEYFTGAHDTGFFGHLHALCLSGLSWTTALSVNWVAAQPKLSSVNSWRFQYESSLTAHNWQKWKRVFLTCLCHEIYRDEAVGLKSYNYTLKITIFVNMWNLGQFLENLIFCQ